MKTLLIGLVLSMSLFAMPAVTEAAGLVPCGGTGERACQSCDVVTLEQNVIGWIIMVMGFFAILIAVYAGVKLVTAGGNRHAMEEAKSMMTNMFIGYVLVLAAWLLVDYGMKALLDVGKFGVWNKIDCVEQKVAEETKPMQLVYSNPVEILASNSSLTGWGAMGSQYPGSIAKFCARTGGYSGIPEGYDCSAQIAECTGVLRGTPTIHHGDSGDVVSCAPSVIGSTGGSGGGSCSVLSSGPCSAENLIPYFGARATEASMICNHESGGAPIPSGSDICCGRDGSCSGDPSFSGGYFQINILSEANKIPGCNISTFFNKNGTEGAQGDCIRRNADHVCTGWSCTITLGPAYNTCMQGTLNPAINLSVAKQLFSTRGFQPWVNSSHACNIPY